MTRMRDFGLSGAGIVDSTAGKVADSYVENRMDKNSGRCGNMRGPTGLIAFVLIQVISLAQLIGRVCG